jgi:hypothetical protein
VLLKFHHNGYCCALQCNHRESLWFGHYTYYGNNRMEQKCFWLSWLVTLTTAGLLLLWSLPLAPFATSGLCANEAALISSPVMSCALASTGNFALSEYRTVVNEQKIWRHLARLYRVQRRQQVVDRRASACMKPASWS